MVVEGRCECMVCVSLGCLLPLGGGVGGIGAGIGGGRWNGLGKDGSYD